MMDASFERLSDTLGVPVDKVRYVTLFFLSLPLASFLRVVLHYSYTSTTIRHTLCVLLGLIFAWICFKWQVLYLVGFVSVGYIILITIPPSVVQRYSMMYALASISAGHIYRLYTDYGGYTLDFTGPLMILVQRVSYVAFAYHDGVARDDKELTEDQRRHKINVIPSLLEYFSYNFCFMTILAGPTATYKEHDDFITGRNMIGSGKHSRGTDPNPLIPVLKKMSLALLFLSIAVLNGHRYKTELLLDPHLSLLRRIFNITMFALVMRCQYYFTFLIGYYWFSIFHYGILKVDSISNSGGLGYNALADDESKRWSLVTMIDIPKVEFASCARDLISGWNLTTMNWLRRLVYDRGDRSVLLTNMASAIWHGYYPGYYVSFVFAGVGTLAGRKLRQITRNRFDSSRVYTVLCIITVALLRDFNFITFQLLFLKDVFFIWRCYYFLPGIGLLLVLLLPIAPKKKNN